MFKKLASLFLSLLLSITLLPGQAGAANLPEDAPPVQAEAAVQTDESGLSVASVYEDFPEEEVVNRTAG